MSKSPSGNRSKRRSAKPRVKARTESPWTEGSAFERSEGIAAARGETGVPHAMFILHLERLTDITARCGEEAEAALLDLVALVLTNLTGEQFPLYRPAVDEIAVIKDRCVPSQVSHTARRMCAALETGVFIWHGRQFRLAVSIGAVILVPVPGGPGALIRRAREACAAARETGSRGCIMLDGTERQRIQLESDRGWLEHLGQTVA